MKQSVLVIFLIILITNAQSQAITSLNFSHWYNSQNEVALRLLLSRGQNNLYINYDLQANQFPVDQYSISWERRDSYSSREGDSIRVQESSASETGTQKSGLLTFDLPEKPWLLLAKVTHIQSQKSWYYFRLMENIYPIKGWIEKNGKTISEKYINPGTEYTLKSCDQKLMFVSYYKTNSFYQAYPPFSEKSAPAERFLFHDSTFKLENNSRFTLNREGLYLFQQDTSAADGFAIRVVADNYPKYTRIEDLAYPLIFVTTPEEYKLLISAGNEKPKFDKVILDMTRDKERAKNFMRSYFRRVELANYYFTSFKEGWKTDRGMIYLIFGAPDELGKNGGNEVWSYKNSGYRFTFVKSGSVYDPDNYVLLRDKRFMEPWYSTIDLWRKSRF